MVFRNSPVSIFLKNLLEYIWLTVLCKFLLYSKVNYIYMYTHTHTNTHTRKHTHTYIPFLILSSIMVYPKRLIEFPTLRTSLPIHSKCKCFHLLTLNSQSIPLTPLSPLATSSLFSISTSLFLCCR